MELDTILPAMSNITKLQSKYLQNGVWFPASSQKTRSEPQTDSDSFEIDVIPLVLSPPSNRPSEERVTKHDMKRAPGAKLCLNY